MTPMLHHKFSLSPSPIPAEAWMPSEVRFLSVWEIPQMMKCPLMGTCLSIEDHQRLLKKAGICTRRMSPPALHEAVMTHIEGPTKAARRIDAFFRKNFESQALPWLHASEPEIRKLWDQGLENGDIERPLYIIACRSNISSALQFHTFGILHMLGHTAKRDLMECRRTITKLENALASEGENLRKIQREQVEERKRMQGEMGLLQEHLRALSHAPSLSSEKKESPRETLDLLNERVRRLKEKNQALTERIRKLEAERENQRRSLEPLETRPGAGPSPMTFLVPDAVPWNTSVSENSPPPLMDKRILVVGGRPCMRARYRDAVESAGGHFEYHDGCIHGGKQTLESRVRRSDLVLCPVNCNSHGACGLVKEICRKHGKCLRMLDSFSCSAIASALSKAAAPSSPESENTHSPPLIAGNRFSAMAP
jgi:hypothetical protein